MSVSVTITNTTSSTLYVDELYTFLGPSGATNASVTITRSQAQLDGMVGLKALLHAGTVTVDMVGSSDNEQLMSISAGQQGIVSGLDVTSVAVVTSAVTYPQPYHTAVVPTIDLTMAQGAATGWKGHAYARAVTNTGFTIALDVTTATGAFTGENPTMSPAEDGVAVGPFTTTLAHVPLTSAVVTLHWLESTVAKTATITGSSTLGGANSANLASASITRTTGALSVTFAMGHPPDTNSITVDYTQTSTGSVHWTAKN